MFQFDQFIYCRWQSNRRYYTAEIIQDLFGIWILRLSWGGLHSRKGNYREKEMPNYDEALLALEEVDKRRKQRGYNPIECSSKHRFRAG